MRCDRLGHSMDAYSQKISTRDDLSILLSPSKVSRGQILKERIISLEEKLSQQQVKFGEDKNLLKKNVLLLEEALQNEHEQLTDALDSLHALEQSSRTENEKSAFERLTMGERIIVLERNLRTENALLAECRTQNSDQVSFRNATNSSQHPFVHFFSSKLGSN